MVPLPTDCHLRVLESSGCTVEEWHTLNANLGVSFSKTRYFSKRMMSCYVHWISSRFDRLLIIVADHLEVYNAQVFKQLTCEEATRRSLTVGRQLCASYRKAIPGGLGGRVSISLASDIIQEPGCQVLIARLEHAARSHARFRHDVHQSVETALAGKIARVKNTGVNISGAMETLANYLIEEIGIVLYLNHIADVRYPLMIVPHFIPAVLPTLYEGPHAGLFEDITRGDRFRSMKLAVGPD
jgi:tRNA-dependent cyclodipeptide synthase